MANSQRRLAAVLDPVYYPVVALVLVLVACVDLCDAITVVDVYRLVQYDLSGVPFGSRLATLNHHAGSSLFASVDLSRTVLMLPVRELNLDLIKGSRFYILLEICIFSTRNFDDEFSVLKLTLLTLVQLRSSLIIVMTFFYSN